MIVGASIRSCRASVRSLETCDRPMRNASDRARAQRSCAIAFSVVSFAHILSMDYPLQMRCDGVVCRITS